MTKNDAKLTYLGEKELKLCHKGKPAACSLISCFTVNGGRTVNIFTLIYTKGTKEKKTKLKIEEKTKNKN